MKSRLVFGIGLGKAGNEAPEGCRCCAVTSTGSKPAADPTSSVCVCHILEAKGCEPT